MSRCSFKASQTPSPHHRSIKVLPEPTHQYNLGTAQVLNVSSVSSCLSSILSSHSLSNQTSELSTKAFSTCINSYSGAGIIIRIRNMVTLVERMPLLLCLPPELILDSLSRIDYTPGCFDNLRLVCRELNNIIQRFEHGLTVEIIRLQFPPGILARYPGLRTSEIKLDFRILDELCIRMYTLSRLERNCHNIRRREGKEAAWMRPEWINLHQAGMHILYRLHDAGSHENKSQVIRSLPPTSLAILLLTLYLCIHQLRADGPSLLVPTSPLLHGMLRFEVELCCQELILQHGPSFLDALLCHCPNAIALLETEVRNMEARQLPSEDGKAREKTLIAECRCRLACSLGTNVEDNRIDMWNVLKKIGTLGEADVVKVIRGEELAIKDQQDSGVEL